MKGAATNQYTFPSYSTFDGALEQPDSKFEPPSLPSNHVNRGHLIRWLSGQSTARLTLVSAGPGFGKTTLLAEFAKSAGARCVWIRLDTGDGDLPMMADTVLSALRFANPAFIPTSASLPATLSRNPTASDMTRLVSSIVRDMEVFRSGRTFFIVDDDASTLVLFPLVCQFIGALIAACPENVGFVVASRARPRLSLGRLAAQGRLAELGASELRFASSEITSYLEGIGLPVTDRRLTDAVVRDTSGWPALVRLLAGTVTERPRFDGESAPKPCGQAVADFVSEEVLGPLSASERTILRCASMLHSIEPSLLFVAAEVVLPDVCTRDISRLMNDATRLGVLEMQSTGPVMNPIVKAILERELASSSDPGTVHEMHSRVARAAETVNWRAACLHFIDCGLTEEVGRLIGANAREAIGAGSFGVAAELLGHSTGLSVPPAVDVVRARALAAAGKNNLAVAVLSGLRDDRASVRESRLAGLVRANALQMSGRGDELWAQLQQLSGVHDDDDLVLGSIGEAWRTMIAACRGSSVADARRGMTDAAAAARRAGLAHFSGVGLHNAATAALAMGDYQSAIETSARALEVLGESAAAGAIVPSALMVQALATLETQPWELGLQLAEGAYSAREAHGDVIADFAYVLGIAGETEEAHVVELRLRRVLADEPLSLGTEPLARFAQLAIAVSLGRLDQADDLADRLHAYTTLDLDGHARRAWVRALVDCLNGNPRLEESLRNAASIIVDQRAWRWESRMRIVNAAASGDAVLLRRWIVEAARSSRLALLETADVICTSLHLLEPLPDDLRQAVAAKPRRWRAALTREVLRGRPSGEVAARLLAEYGGVESARTLRDFERARRRRGRESGLSRTLLRRLSPTLRIHDLGKTVFQVGEHQLRASDTRRRASSLLMYLVTRPNQRVSKEQAMEALWPGQPLGSARNSLHQTLHFIRRYVDPWHTEGLNVDYVTLEGDMIYLDSALVHVDSVSFLRQANDIIKGGSPVRDGPGLLGMYLGRFAPEFEYDDWAEDWRTLVHATYLHLAQSTADGLVDQGRDHEAIQLLTRAVELDGRALELMGRLVRLHHRLGATDAASTTYRRYAALMRREYGVRPPTLRALIGQQPVVVATS